MLDQRPATRTSPRLLRTWLALLGLSQAADLSTTWVSLAAGGTEQNPFVVAALGSGHFLLFAVVKTMLVVAFGILLLRGRPLALAAARLLVAVFVAVALANLLGAIT